MKKILLCAVMVIGVIMGVTLPSTHASSKTPRIVAQQSFLNQSGSLSATTIFTPTSEGDFRVSVYASGASSLSGATLGVLWTDARANRTFAPSISDSFVSSTEVVHSAVSQPIQVEVLTSNTAYDVYVTIEEL